MTFLGWLKLPRDSSCRIVFVAFICLSRPMKMLTGGSSLSPKTFTFGDNSLQGLLHAKYDHCETFRLVGGSFTVRQRAVSLTELEKKRFEKWHNTIRRLRYAPVPWKSKAKMLLATQTQALWGQGTHSFTCDVDYLKKIRSDIMRTMFKCDFYSFSVPLTFSLLLPPQLDPFFGPVYHGLRTVTRCMRNNAFAETVKKRILQLPSAHKDGPTQRLRELIEHTTFGPLVREMVGNVTLNEQEWAHRLRQSWRSFLWNKATGDRPQHYSDLGNVDMDKTMALYKELSVLADVEEWVETEGYAANVDDARAKLGVLRRLLTGGLLSEERNARHRKIQDTPCSCGGKQTVMHISWDCPNYDSIRRPYMKNIPHKGKKLPLCTKYSGLASQRSRLSPSTVVAVQRMLVEVWQQYIKEWHQSKSPPQPDRADVAVDDGLPAHASSTEDNGHVLQPRLNAEGVWCRKCGRFVGLHKHIRLKITHKKCEFADLPQSQWLEVEGAMRNPNRYKKLEDEMNLRYNKHNHELVWNQRIGKTIGAEDEGIVRCSKCQKWWRWKDRMTALPRATCVQRGNVNDQRGASKAPNPKAASKKRAKSRRDDVSLENSSRDAAGTAASSTGPSSHLFRTGVG